MRRALAWVVVAPLLGSGVLAAHDAAYWLTGSASDGVHGYLSHAPQVLFLASLAGLLLAPSGGHPSRVSAHAFVRAASAIFAVQEHLERMVHGGAVPWLVTSPVFLLGLVLQAPVALLAWIVASRLLRSASDESRTWRPRLPAIFRRVPLPAHAAPRSLVVSRANARAPPLAGCR
jgi:hypothetical protein